MREREIRRERERGEETNGDTGRERQREEESIINFPHISKVSSKLDHIMH